MNSKVKLPIGTANPGWNCECTGNMAWALNLHFSNAGDKSQLLFRELNFVLKVIQNYE